MSENAISTKTKNGIAWTNYTLAMLTAASLSFPDEWMLKIFFAWACTWLFDLIADKRYLRPQFSWKKAGVYALGIYYLLMIVSLLYSDNMDYAGKLMERRLAFVVLPLMVVFGFNRKYRLKPIMLAFIIGCMLSLLYSVSLPFIDYLLHEDIRYLLQKSVPDFFQHRAMSFKHRSYFGVMQLMALACLWHLRKDLIKVWGRKSYQSILVIYFVFLLIHLLFLKGRAPLLGLLGMMLLMVLRLQNTHKRWSYFLLMIILVSGYAVWEYHPRFQKLHFSELLSKEVSLQEKDARASIWYSMGQVLKEDTHWLTGVGVGDLKDQLDAQYAQNGLAFDRLHVHNTPLNSWLELGFPGLLCILFLMLWPFVSVKKSKRWFLLAISIPLYILMMVESFTQTIHGVLLWGMFLMMTAYVEDEKDEEIQCAKWIKPLCFTVFGLMALLWAAFFMWMNKDYNPRNPRTYVINDNTYTLQKQLPEPYPKELQKCWGYQLAAGAASIYREHANAADFASSLYLKNAAAKEFSAWCYVSEDFNGDAVKVQTYKTINGKEEYISCYYDLQRKGSWQKLSIPLAGMPMYAPCSFTFRKNGVRNFDSLQGFVIFALPTFEK